MKGIVFDADIKKYIATLAMSKINKNMSYGGFACTVYNENVKEPELINEDWVKIKTSCGGICGSDLNLIYLHDSLSASAFVSYPFVIGHENVGTIVEAGKSVTNFKVGDRVIADPMLSCRIRGIEDECENCKSGNNALCNNFTKGSLSEGMLLGFCKDTGGSWGEYYVAHKSQLIKVREDMKSEHAVLVDPIASALHPVARNFPSDEENVLVIGSGIVGLMVVACLRALGSKCNITVLARYSFQGKLAEYYGADNVIYGNKEDYFEAFSRITGGELYKPIIGKRVMTGGFEKVYDCVGSDLTIDEALKFTKQSGTMILVGLASIPKGVDWTPIWLKEVKVVGAYCYSTETINGVTDTTYRHALKLIEDNLIDVKPLVTHKFNIKDYKKAIEVASVKGKNKSIKVVFEY